MVSVTGTQHRQTPAGATKQAQASESTHPRGKSEESVGHMAKALADRSPETYSGPSAQGKAAAFIAKLAVEERAALLEELKNPAPAEPTPPTDDTTTPPADETTTPPTDETTAPPADETATPTQPPADQSTDDAAIAILDEIIAAAEENNQPA